MAIGKGGGIGGFIIKRLAGACFLRSVPGGVITLTLHRVAHEVAELALQKGETVVEVGLLARRAKSFSYRWGGSYLKKQDQGQQNETCPGYIFHH
jgi:hypothetical protein